MTVGDRKGDDSPTASAVKVGYNGAVVMAGPEFSASPTEEGFELRRGLKARHITMIGTTPQPFPYSETQPN
jgi:hypothetical protein